MEDSSASHEHFFVMPGEFDLQSCHLTIVTGKDRKIDAVDDFETQAIEELKEKVSDISYIKLSGHSYGLVGCEHLADIIKEANNLREVDFSSIFISRLKEEVPVNLKVLCSAIIDKPVESIDFSHNAFGPSGVPGFDFYLEANP